MDIRGNINFRTNAVSNFVIDKGTSFPTSPAPVEGQLFYRTDEDVLYIYDGSTWNSSAGSNGGLGSYLHTQSSSSSTWTVIHNLNDLKPAIECYNSDGNPFEPQSITINSANQLTVTLGSAATGAVRVHGGTFAGGTGSGNFLPTTTSTYNLGSQTYKWNDIHLSGNLFIGVISSDPSFPIEGQIWYNSTDKQFKGYNGTSIVILG